MGNAATHNAVDAFLSNYGEDVHLRALKLRVLLLAKLPGIAEQLDLPARMIGYCYGQKYAELVCVIFPSKKGLKLGFNGGSSLPDPDGLLEGSGKISRYVTIVSDQQVRSPALKKLLVSALHAYRERVRVKKQTAR